MPLANRSAITARTVQYPSSWGTKSSRVQTVSLTRPRVSTAIHVTVASGICRRTRRSLVAISTRPAHFLRVKAKIDERAVVGEQEHMRPFPIASLSGIIGKEAGAESDEAVRCDVDTELLANLADSLDRGLVGDQMPGDGEIKTSRKGPSLWIPSLKHYPRRHRGTHDQAMKYLMPQPVSMDDGPALGAHRPTGGVHHREPLVEAGTAHDHTLNAN